MRVENLLQKKCRVNQQVLEKRNIDKRSGATFKMILMNSTITPQHTLAVILVEGADNFRQYVFVENSPSIRQQVLGILLM